MEIIVVDASLLKIKRKITMMFPNVMDDSHEDKIETCSCPFLKCNFHKLIIDPLMIVYRLRCIFKLRCCKDKNLCMCLLSPWIETMEVKYSEEKLQPMFRALEEFASTHQTLNETFLTMIFCAIVICLGCGFFSCSHSIIFIPADLVYYWK